MRPSAIMLMVLLSLGCGEPCPENSEPSDAGECVCITNFTRNPKGECVSTRAALEECCKCLINNRAKSGKICLLEPPTADECRDRFLADETITVRTECVEPEGECNTACWITRKPE